VETGPASSSPSRSQDRQRPSAEEVSALRNRAASAEVPDDRVAFIVGAARSGTSLLYKALCLHPDAAWISNWVARFPRFPELAVLNRIPRALPARARRVWFDAGSNAYVYGRARSFRDRVFPMPVEGEPVYRRSGIGDAEVDRSNAGTGSQLRDAFGSIRSFSGGRVVISKRIANNLRIPTLARTFPGARFVELVRDGRAVAFSLSRVDWWPASQVWWYGGTPEQWRAEGLDPWAMCARNWVEELAALREGFASVTDPQILRLRYEELVADPVSVLERVATFVGLEPSDRWRAALDRLSFPDRNEAWRERLDAEVVARITSVQREELERLGYAR
jgi:hypothetical protein